MANNYADRARVGGSGFTVYSWKLGKSGPKVVTFARQVSHISPSPVGAGVVPIHPMDLERPAHLITPQAISMGQITFELYELQTTKAFQKLPGLENCLDLVDVFAEVADQGAGGDGGLTIEKWILNPGQATAKALNGSTDPSALKSNQARVETYTGCVVANILDGDTVEVGTMEVLKQVVVNYASLVKSSSARPTVV